MINYIYNISFQKDNFPEIFNSYMYPSNERENCVFYAKETDYLYFLMNNSRSIIEHISECFGVDLKYDLPVSAAIISFGYENSIVSFDEKLVKVSINHPCLEIYHSVVFSHDVMDSFLEKSCVFYSFVDKQLKQVTELQIRSYFQDYHFKTHNLSNYEKLLEIISLNKPKYFFEKNIMHKTKRLYINEMGYGEKYSLLLISIINDSLTLKESEIIQNCVNGIMDRFQIRGKEIIEKYLQTGEFDINFIIVEKYFQFEKECKKELTLYLKDTLKSSIRKYNKMKNNNTALYNLISNDSGILEVDDYMNKKIEELNCSLEVV